MNESSPDACVPEGPTVLATSNQLSCGPLLAGIAALLGGLLTWCLVLAWFPIFNIPPELSNLPSPMPEELAIKQQQAMAVAARQNVMVALALFGLLAAFSVTAVEAYRRRVLSSIWWRGALAGIVAAGVGAGAGALGATVFAALKPTADLQPLVKTIIMQAAMLGLTGIGVGVGVGVAFGRIPLAFRGAMAGFFGGGLAAILYPAVVGYLLPNSQTERVIPDDTLSSLLWLVIAAAMIGVVLGGLGRKSSASNA